MNVFVRVRLFGWQKWVVAASFGYRSHKNVCSLIAHTDRYANIEREKKSDTNDQIQQQKQPQTDQEDINAEDDK